MRLAAWSGTCRVRLFEVGGTACRRWTGVCPALRRPGLKVEEREIDARPLDAVCAELGVREVHFLKVDVEGAETKCYAA